MSIVIHNETTGYLAYHQRIEFVSLLSKSLLVFVLKLKIAALC